MSFELSKLIETTLLNLKKDFSGTNEEFDKKIEGKLPEINQILCDTFKHGLLSQYQNSILKDLKNKRKTMRIICIKIIRKHLISFRFSLI
jgi:hypothetical protein